MTEEQYRHMLAMNHPPQATPPKHMTDHHKALLFAVAVGTLVAMALYVLLAPA